MTLLWLPFLTTALYYLLARAILTEWLWSKYPPRMDRFFSCAACSGFWYGLFFALVLIPGASDKWLEPGGPVCIGLASMVWTPILAGLQEFSINYLTHQAVTFRTEDHGAPE